MMLVWQSIGGDTPRLVQHRLRADRNETCCGLPVENVVTPETGGNAGDLWHADHQVELRYVIHCGLCKQAGCK